MKKLLIAIAVLLISVSSAQATEVVLTWDATDFGTEAVNECGYNLYHKNGEGERTLLSPVPRGTETFTHAEVPFGINCYVLTAYNKYGESDFSVEVCTADIHIPPIPSNPSISIVVNVTVNLP